MFLNLAHTKLDVFIASRDFVLECYRLTQELPADEKFSLTSQVRRATLSVHLNIAEGCSRKSPTERKRYYEIARGSLIEVDAALDIALQLQYLHPDRITLLGEKIITTFKLLSGLIGK